MIMGVLFFIIGGIRVLFNKMRRLYLWIFILFFFIKKSRKKWIFLFFWIFNCCLKFRREIGRVFFNLVFGF